MLTSTVAAYRDVYNEREFAFDCEVDVATITGSPELIIQMLDKLVDNAVDFSHAGDTISIGLRPSDDDFEVSVMNPGAPLPEKMRTQMFDSMVSMRAGKDSKHLGLGLYVARLIAEGHGGKISAHNVTDGVCFSVSIPRI